MPQSIALEGLTILDGGLPGASVVDFVFLHGLNGSPKGTWTYQNGNDDVPDGFFWPGQLLVDIPGCRVMTFGYNALFERALVQNTATINDIALTLVSQLIANRRGPDYVDRPLVLISHSLGGLVIKRALWNIHHDRSSGKTPTPRRIKEQNAIYDSVAGIVFMGTPHSGSHVTNAARVKVLKAIARATFTKVPENLINALSAHSFELQELSRNFENTTIFSQHIIEICTYYETKTQKFLGEEVVPLEMTVLHYQNERTEPIPNEHTKMIKFESANDNLYKSVCDRLKEMATDGIEARTARQVTYRILQVPGTVHRVEASRFLSTCGDSVLGQSSNIRVHSLASRVGQAPSSKIATVTFVQVPRILLEHRKSKQRHWSIPFEHEGCHKAITVDVQGTFHGFTFLNDVQPDEHCLDIIALPSLGYDPFRSWQDMAASDASMWLRDQLPELVPGSQVALYGYDIDFESQ
ncbi:hypothetical protein QBC37DRAFT_186794 [Rhypophila decipiens]|uniref:DUF676 domain-containing protein n=1 Tax=Rhypophila decipiens TaxID=261697 RepID=A0AAN6Y4Z7_9PEZI|nr:hypothetical protein QBC37DRAFT_186794 [Rhypophila decipiens]